MCYNIKIYNTAECCLQGSLVNQNMSSGIIISTQSLVLQKVSRLHSGSYSCLAANPKGETVSDPVNLRVRCEYNEIE